MRWVLLVVLTMGLSHWNTWDSDTSFAWVEYPDCTGCWQIWVTHPPCRLSGEVRMFDEDNGYVGEVRDFSTDPSPTLLTFVTDVPDAKTGIVSQLDCPHG